MWGWKGSPGCTCRSGLISSLAENIVPPTEPFSHDWGWGGFFWGGVLTGLPLCILLGNIEVKVKLVAVEIKVKANWLKEHNELEIVDLNKCILSQYCISTLMTICIDSY